MKKRFTFLIAAIAAILMMAQPKMVMGQTTVTQTSFNTIGGNVNSDTKVTYQAYKGGAGTDPATYSNAIRLYQISNNNYVGGYIVIGVPSGYVITSATIQSGQATTAGYKLMSSDPGNTTPSNFDVNNYSLSANTDYTVENISTRYIVFGCFGTSSNKRLNVKKISITYQSSGGGGTTTAAPTISGNTPFVGSTTVTITNAASADGADIFYTLNGDNPTTTTSATCFAYNAPFSIDATKTVKAIAKKSTDANASSVETKNFTKVTPMTVSDALTVISSLGNNGTSANQCVSGIVCTAGSLSNGAITYYISDDGTTTNRLQVYKGKGLYNANFTAATDIAVGDEVVVYGTLKNYNGNTPEFDAGSYLLSKVRGPVISTSVTELTGFTYVEGHGPSTTQTVSVSGSNLTANISLSLGDNSNFEMCQTQDGTYTNSLTLTQSEGAVSATNVYVRLKSGLAKAANYSGTITLTSTGATTKTVSLSGSVTGQTYAVNVATGLTGGSIEADPTSAEAGATIALTATPDAAYTFGSWSVYKYGDSQTTVTVSNNQFTMPAYAVDVTATFSAKPTYAVTCVANPVAGGTIATEQTPAYEGQSVGLTITPTSGYSLSSVAITKTSDGSATDITVTNNTFTMPGYAVTVTATFVSEIFNGTFMQVSSENALENNGYYIIYNTSAMNSSISSGQMGATSVQISESTISNPNRAIVWKLVQNGDNWNLYSEKEGKYCFINGNETNSFSMGETSTTSFAVSYNNGFKFKSTHTNGRCIGYGNPFKSYADNTNNASANTLTLYKYTAGERTITFNGNGGTYNEATSYNQTVNDGIPAALTNNQFTNDNAAFAGWATSAGGSVVYANGAQIMIHNNTTLYAKWNQAYTATVDSPITGGSVYIVTGSGNQTTTNAAEGTEITLTHSASLGYAFSAWDVYKTGETATKVTVTNNKFTMPAYNVTISATFEEATTYSLITDINDLVSGKRYIIASGANGNNIQAMGSQNNSHYRNVVPVSSDNGVIVEPENVYEFVINGPEIITKNNQTVLVYTIYDVTGASGGYIYASSSSDNYMDTQAFNDNNGKWTISIANSGAATIEAQGDNTRYKMRFNSNRFSCYGSNTSVSALPYIYMKNEVTPQYEFYKDITAHTNATGLGNTDGWYFIASPVNSNLNPSDIDNMLTDETQAPYSYDLYRLNGNQLENYNNNEHTAGFVIANGAGYLYSNAANTTLKFSGTLIKEYNNTNKTVAPAHTGWNLIGNPFTFPVRVSRAFSELNNGSAVNSKDANSIINPGAGIIVYGTEGVTFAKYEPEEQSSGSNNINIMLAQQVVSRDGFSITSVAIDNAVISFNENSNLPKFTLLEGNAKLYIPQNGEDYAIAFSNRQGDMPLNFKTTEAGMYTISFEGDNMDLKGVYLIDMLAEEEIDLSVDPSYTFIGSPADKAERFKIVFRGFFDGASDDIFAFQSGSDIIVSGEGELQIFDVMGRKVKTQYVSGVQTVNINAQGVYIMKLNEKTQKIIVR